MALPTATATPTKIMVADDSEAERAAAREALIPAGYHVVEAIDGQHALEVFARERPDLVLLDVVMPRLTGLETCRILKAKTQSSYLPVIMLSTRNSVNARVEGLRSGADDYLGKPYDAEELRARVEALLRARRVLGEGDGEAEAPTPAEGTTTARRRDPAESHAAFRRRLEEEFDRAERYSDPLACLRVELAGYEPLAERTPTTASALVDEMRAVIDSSIRKIDLIHRRDERGYILVLPNTHFPGALAVAERIWRDAKRLHRPAELPEPPGVSVGVSFYPNKNTHSLKDLLALVDAALDHARAAGGAKICLYQHQGYLYTPED